MFVDIVRQFVTTFPTFQVLEEEIGNHRLQVEDMLDRGQSFLKDQFVDNRSASFMESEGKS